MLTLAMLVPAGAAACCVVADPHRRAVRVWLPAALMLLAMLDSALFNLVPALLWSVALGAVAMASALAARMHGAADGMQLHRCVAAVVMAVVLLGMPAGSVGHSHGPGLGAALGLAVALLLVSGVWLAVRLVAERRRVLAAEPVLMALSIALMFAGH